MDAVTAHGHSAIKQGSKSFALASRALPPALRDDASMLYAWCRYCDDVIDGQIMGHEQIADYKLGQGERLERLRAETAAALNGEPTDNPIYAGLARVFKTHDINHKHAFELLKGFEMDAQDRVYKTVNDILDYSYHVAGVVGVMMANIMGVRDDATLDRASDLGLAFQLTNIARDLVDDARADRVFIPQDLLNAAGAPLTAHELAKPENWPAAHKAAMAQLDIAEAYYDSAKAGVKELPFRCAWAISAALSVYREIGQRLREGGPQAWEGRVSASKPRKITLALGAVGPALTRKKAIETSREMFYQRPL
ncbi:phytoene/squalene synthase family protein [Robiginitomaculum antarcticum]|uniref:phytoene/squalene synthase family protein n=1 Tax=Robiginitomaculum antarcticum TaxID=437507 RepID=UPI00036592DC|nr:phytoene/squalene synthase family protein [Robiginitomaculum antarcticum]